MAELRPYRAITLKECAQLIIAIGMQIVVMARGEMGIGKSSMLAEVHKAYPDHIPCYVDMTTKDVGDLLMPSFIEVNGMKVCSFIPNAEFGFQHGRPLIIMWDEFTKANKTVQTQCIRALQEWQLGEHKFPEGTIQFATGNLTEEGVADSLQAHHGNRIDNVIVSKPGPVEWTQNFALDNNVHPTVIQAVNQFPQMLMSWTDFETPGENPYIYDPRRPMPAFVSPRSLEKFSTMLHLAGDLPEHVKIHAGAGLVGDRAAADIMSIDALYNQLATWEDIMRDPAGARLPESPGAQCLFVYSAIQRVEEDTVAPLMKYVKRMSREAQALFATTAVNTTKADVVMGNRTFFEWAEENMWQYAANG
jgi:hypothetical protein